MGQPLFAGTFGKLFVFGDHWERGRLARHDAGTVGARSTSVDQESGPVTHRSAPHFSPMERARRPHSRGRHSTFFVPGRTAGIAASHSGTSSGA